MFNDVEVMKKKVNTLSSAMNGKVDCDVFDEQLERLQQMLASRPVPSNTTVIQ